MVEIFCWVVSLIDILKIKNLSAIVLCFKTYYIKSPILSVGVNALRGRNGATRERKYRENHTNRENASLRKRGGGRKC